jgi:hypothetical protein
MSGIDFRRLRAEISMRQALLLVATTYRDSNVVRRRASHPPPA